MEKIKITFFENIFYWLWNWGEKRNEEAAKEGSCLRAAAPERSHALITGFQYANFMFFISLILNMLNRKTIVSFFEINPIFTLAPLVSGFVILLIVHGMIFNKKKYNKLKEKYAQMTDTERREAKKTYIIYAIVSILTGIIAVILWSLLPLW